MISERRGLEPSLVVDQSNHGEKWVFHIYVGLLAGYTIWWASLQWWTTHMIFWSVGADQLQYQGEMRHANLNFRYPKGRCRKRKPTERFDLLLWIPQRTWQEFCQGLEWPQVDTMKHSFPEATSWWMTANRNCVLTYTCGMCLKKTISLFLSLSLSLSLSRNIGFLYCIQLVYS